MGGMTPKVAALFNLFILASIALLIRKVWRQLRGYKTSYWYKEHPRLAWGFPFITLTFAMILLLEFAAKLLATVHQVISN
jgi:hypothetical protein